MLEFEKESLAQLEKMYKSKDLTEETEKIILKRQKFWVEWAELEFKQAEIQRDLIFKVKLPRQEKALTDGLAKAVLALEKAKQTLAPQVNEKEQALVKLRHDQDTLTRQLDNLQKDRQAMTIKAPMAGVVYFGKFHQGKWTNAADLADNLVPNGTIKADQVLMTIMNPKPSVVRILVDEKDIHLIKADMKGKGKVPFHPDLKLPAKVISVAPLPSQPGKYETLVSLNLEEADTLMPGMACSIKFVPYAKKDALVIPRKALFEEEERSFVWVMADGKKEKREVEPGRSAGDHMEIVKGLSAGEAIVADAKEGEKMETSAKKGTNP
jgi:multidrug efflux pump subunit AcrA (membrane-fusion protein)